MRKHKFSIGYNQDLKGFTEILKKHKEKIKSIYFPIPTHFMGSGRGILQNDFKKYISEIITLLKLSKKLEIEPIMLLNATIFDYTKISEIITFISQLKEKYNLNHIVCTNPFLITRIHKKLPNVLIEVSIVSYVRTLEEARKYKELGAKIIAISRDEIRNIELIKEMNKIIKVKVLLNEGCVKNCIYKYMHYNDLSMLSNINFVKNKKINNDRCDGLCARYIYNHPHKIFSAPFIRPEDLKYYNNLDVLFKLSTRNFPTKQIENTLIAYYNKEYDGNLNEILNSITSRLFEYIDNSKLNNINFFEKLSQCDDNCEKCGFCKELFPKVAKLNKIEYEKYKELEKF